MYIANFTPDMINWTHAGQNGLLKPGDIVEFNDARGKHILNKWGQRGLIRMSYGDEGNEDELRKQAMEIYTEFWKHQVSYFNRQNLQRENEDKALIEPSKELIKKAEEKGVSDRVHVVNHSMLDMDFLDESFDILWAEGSIFVIGFEKGLTAWRRYIRPGGFLVVHEMTWLQADPPQEILDHWTKVYPGIRTDSENIKFARDCGLELIDHFPVPEEVWWHDYYDPLEILILQLHEKYAMDQAALKVLEKEQHEVDLYRKYSKWYGSAFYIMRKPASAE